MTLKSGKTGKNPWILTVWCYPMARCAVSSGLLLVHQGVEQRCPGGAVRLQQSSGILRAIPGAHEFTAHRQWRGGDMTQQSIFSIPFHPQARIWDSVFLKFLWILKSYQRVVCLRLCAMLRPWSVGCSFKELFWLEVLQGILLERDAPAAELSIGAAFLGWANSQHITHDLVTKLLSMLKVKSQSLSIWSFPGGESFYFFYSPLVDAEGEGGCICCCIFLYGSCIESSLLSIL